MVVWVGLEEDIVSDPSRDLQAAFYGGAGGVSEHAGREGRGEGLAGAFLVSLFLFPFSFFFFAFTVLGLVWVRELGVGCWGGGGGWDWAWGGPLPTFFLFVFLPFVSTCAGSPSLLSIPWK